MPSTNYTSIDDLELEFSNSELAKLTGDPSGATINNDRIDNACQYAKSLIDATLFGLYSLPIEAENIIIKNISKDISIFRLYQMEYKNRSIPDNILIRYNSALKMLDNCKNGKFENEIIHNGNSIISNKTAENRYFSNEKLNAILAK